MDKSWVYSYRSSQEYDDKVQAFLDYAYAHGVKDEKGNLRCPCVGCKNFDFRDRDTIYEHLVCDGMLRCYTTWYHHGERRGTTSTLETRVEKPGRYHGVGIGVKGSTVSGGSSSTASLDEEIRMLRKVIELLRKEGEEMQRHREERQGRCREEMKWFWEKMKWFRDEMQNNMQTMMVSWHNSPSVKIIHQCPRSSTKHIWDT